MAMSTPAVYEPEDATAILMGNLTANRWTNRAHPLHAGPAQARMESQLHRIGSGGRLFEPIESTNIHLIQTAVSRLMALFPRADFDHADIDELNTQTRIEYERARDFIVLHYKATERDDTPFWQYCRTMEVPPTLQHKIDLYRSNGRFFREEMSCGELSWVQVMEGQRIRASGYHPLPTCVPVDEVRAFPADTARHLGMCRGNAHACRIHRAALRLNVSSS
jgi:tryptophan halogenase